MLAPEENRREQMMMFEMSFQNLLHILLSDMWYLVKICPLFDF